MDWGKLIGSLLSGLRVNLGGTVPGLPPPNPDYKMPEEIKPILKLIEIMWPGDGDPPEKKTKETEEEKRSWLADLLTTVGATVPALVGGILSNKATQEAYDKYSLVGARAVERAQNIAWATYQQSRQDLAPFRGGGAAAYNQYLTMIGVDPKSIIPSEQDIADTKLRFPGGPPILGAVLKPIDPIEPDPKNPNPIEPGPVDRNFNPSDYASLYRDVGDAKRSPTEGINQLKELFWGNRGDAMGFGGIMGATLSGQMSLGTANTLGKYLYSRWSDDMRRSGVSQEDFVRSINSQSAVKDLTNNIINLKEHGSVSINNTHYSGFKSNEAGLITNGQENIGMGTLLYWPGDAGSDSFIDYYSKKFPTRYSAYPEWRPAQPPRDLNPPVTPPVIPDPDDRPDPSGPDPELPVGPPGTIPDPWGLGPDPTQPTPIFPDFTPTPIPTGPPGDRLSGARPLADVMSQEEENEVQEGLAGWKPKGVAANAYAQALQDRREQDVRAAAALPPDEREAAARQAGDAMNEGPTRVNSLREYLALEDRLRSNIRNRKTQALSGVPPPAPTDTALGQARTTPGHPYVQTSIVNEPGLPPVRLTPQQKSVLWEHISMAKFEGVDWSKETIKHNHQGRIYAIPREDQNAPDPFRNGRLLGTFIGDWSSSFNIVPGPGQTPAPGSDLMLEGHRTLKNISDFEKIGRGVPPLEQPTPHPNTGEMVSFQTAQIEPPPAPLPPSPLPRPTPGVGGPLYRDQPDPVPTDTALLPTGGRQPIKKTRLRQTLPHPLPPPVTPPTPPPPVTPPPGGTRERLVGEEYPQWLNRQVSEWGANQAAGYDPGKPPLGMIPDQYGFRTSPLYQYRKREGEKDIMRHLRSIGHSRSTYGMNTMMKFYDKLLAEGSEQQLSRLSDAAKLGLSAATASAAGAQVAGEQLARLQQSAGALQGEVAIGRGMSGASLADFLGGLPLAGLDMWNRLQK